MDSGYVNLSLLQIISAYVFILILLLIVKLKKINREKEILISSIRMTLQLIAMGYILTYLFENINPIYTVIAILLMECFAINNIIKKCKIKDKRLKKIISYSIIIGTLSCLSYFILVVIKLPTWYDPSYVIPLAGMLIGNSMTGISLGITTLINGMESESENIETLLMLGITTKEACRGLVNKSFDAAILPTINSMIGMGIVFLPGMMTGQILAGINPITAIMYQIAVMLGIVGSVSLSVIILVQQGYKTFFNEKHQLI